jgi:hypothetical protein
MAEVRYTAREQHPEKELAMTEGANTPRKTVARKTTKITAVDQAQERKRARDQITEDNLTPAKATPFTSDIEIRPVRPAHGLQKSDRDNLIKITKARAKVAKSKVAAATAELRADMEKKLSGQFDYEDAMWKEARDIAQQAVCDANEQIARVSDERGVPKEFRPSFSLGWLSRGMNASSSRRAELRKLGEARIKTYSANAVMQIDAQVATVEADVLAGGLSGTAREYLRSMEDPRQLLPTIEVAQLEQEYYAENPWARGDDDDE